MTTFVLIKAGAGVTESVFVANGSRDDLMDIIRKDYDMELTANNKSKSNQAFVKEQRDALISMVRQHQDWGPGRHELRSNEPQEWTLIITNDQYGDFSR